MNLPYRGTDCDLLSRLYRYPVLFYKCVILSGIELTYSMAVSNSVENPSQLVFFRLKCILDVVGCGTRTVFTVKYIGRCCVRRMGSRTDFSHIFEMFDDTKMRSGLFPLRPYCTVE